MSSAPYNLEKTPPLNFLELHLKERGYILYAVCLTSDEYQVQEQMRSCCKRMSTCPGLELVSTQNQWVTRFWMRTRSIAVERGDVSEDQMSLPLVTPRRSSAPPLFPAQNQQKLSEMQAAPSLFPDRNIPTGEAFTSTSQTVPSDPLDGTIRGLSTLPASGDRLTLPDGPGSAWDEPGSATPAIRPPPIGNTFVDASMAEIDEAPGSVPIQSVNDADSVEARPRV